jgi:autophagy-related protein 2
VTEQNLSNSPNDYPSSSLDSDLSTSPSSRYASSPTLNTTTNIDSSPPTNSSVFIKHFVFSPGCHIRIDYHGKLSNEQLFESGPLLNLLIGLAQLAKVDIYLKRISYNHGLLGYEKLLTFLLNEWLNDIHPAHLIRGIVPLASISQIVIGIKDLFYLPIDQYLRDGRILRGFQRGASSFTTNTALAFIELSSQFVRCAHFAALLCFELVSTSTLPTSNGSITSSSSPTQAIMVRNHPPPNDIREGATYAVNVIRQSFNTTSHQLRTEAQSGRRRRGILGVIGSILRQMPSVALQPIVTTTKAAENFLVGVGNQIDRDKRNDDQEKYRMENKN